jgi:DNA-binding beta-propeller fold protein YncE
VALDPIGDMYISDGYGNARVHKFSAGGKLLFSWGSPGKRAPGEFHVPHGVWVHTDGRVFVADRENNRIQIFSPDGRFLDQWTDFARPCDIYVDSESTMYVVELDAFVSIVTISGRLLTRWLAPTKAEPGTGGHALWLDSRGDMYVNRNLEGQRLLKYRRLA